MRAKIKTLVVAVLTLALTLLFQAVAYADPISWPPT